MTQPPSTEPSSGSTEPTQRPTRGAGKGAVALVLGVAVSVQFGAAVAALLFPRVGVAGVVTLCLVIAAPLGLAAAGTSLLYPVTIGLGAAVAASSSVVPYTWKSSRCIKCRPLPSRS
ncbi:MAG: hypothetical protein ACRDQI_03225 [Pseudonocardiaceae bacterium]